MTTKPIKLAPKQQEVVNRMAAGWKLAYWKSVFNRKPSCSLMNADESYKVPANMAGQLLEKGVVRKAAGKSSHWACTEYVKI